MRKTWVFCIFTILIFSSFIVVFNPGFNVSADAPYADNMWYSSSKVVATKSECESLTGESYNNIHAESSLGVTTDNGTIFLNFLGGEYGDGACKRVFFVRSFDNGATWTDPEIFVMGHATHPLLSWAGTSTKCVYADSRIYAFVMFPERNQPIEQSHCYLIYSEDNGDSWVGLDSNHYVNDSALNLTGFFAEYMTGQWNINGGIQMRSGRVIVSGFEYVGSPLDDVFTAYTDDISNFSDDDWVFTGVIHGDQLFSENIVVELNNGSLYRTIRPPITTHRRYYSFSWDSGDNWIMDGQQGANYFPYHIDIVDPKSWGSVVRWTSTLDGYSKNRILLSWNNATGSRTDLSVGVSYNECELDGYNSGFNVTKEVENPAVEGHYPYLMVAPNKTILFTYRPQGGYNGQTELLVEQFNVEWLTGGEDTVLSPSTPISDGFNSINNLENTSVLSGSPYLFNWSNQSISGSDYYQLQIANDSGFSDVFLDLQVNESNYGVNYTEYGDYIEFTLPVVNRKSWYGAYYFRVRKVSWYEGE